VVLVRVVDFTEEILVLLIDFDEEVVFRLDLIDKELNQLEGLVGEVTSKTDNLMCS
jgi:hypothetical protein